MAARAYQCWPFTGNRVGNPTFELFFKVGMVTKKWDFPLLSFSMAASGGGARDARAERCGVGGGGRGRREPFMNGS